MSAQRPNILFIITDHQAYFDHRRPGAFTFDLPVYERFCRQGVSFERAYTVCPLCTPARASMMTGQYPSAHGLLWNTEYIRSDNRADFASNTRLYSHWLADAGYRNGYVGKWHCGHERLPADWGIKGWSLPDYGKVYMCPEYRHYAQERGLGDATVRIEHFLNRPDWEGQTMVLHHESPWRFMNGSGVLLGPPEAHEEQFVAHMAVHDMEQLAGGDKPWSLVASFWGPHQPYYPTEPFAGRIDPRSIPRYPTFDDDCSGKPLRHLMHRDLTHGRPRKSWPDWPTWQEVLARCYEQQMQLDAAIGQILDALDRLGQADNTLVIWLADHGDGIASHGGVFDKASTFTEEVARIPMAIRWPAELPAGSRSRALVSNMDATATMLDAAGVARPSGMHSRSLLPICRDAAAPWADALVCEHHGHCEDMLQRVIITEQYKYVAAVYDKDELYDLSADPHEMNNLANSAAHGDVVRDMQRRLVEHIQQTGDRPARERLLYVLQRRLSEGGGAAGKSLNTVSTK